MRTDTPQQIRLKDYRPSNYLIDTVHLDVALDATRTLVVAKLAMRPNPIIKGKASSVRLDGSHIELVSVELDGQKLDPQRVSHR